ncbi:MAG: SAM-dependent methyltransferase [Anaerolineales bacterium]|nr:SAM-dependent methyltransferase [Anaerolineales bacterium]
MKKSQISITAQGIALARALEYDRPAAERICDDPLARKFIHPAFYRLGKALAGYGERKGPGVIGFLVVRCRYMDDCLKESIASGVRQAVILGAGLDSRAYRIAEAKQGVRVFEVDQPATQALKIGKVKRGLGALPPHVAYVPVDFNAEDLEKLISAGYDPGRKTFFIWEGVTHYLTPAAVGRTLAFVAGQSAPGSAIVFDYMDPSALRAEQKRGEVVRMQRTSRFTGEGLKFGIEPGEIEPFLKARGFGRIANMTAGDLHRKYFTGANRIRTVAPIYAIARATVSG